MLVFTFACLVFVTELEQLPEVTEKATISEVKGVPSQKQASGELGGLSEAEKKRLVAQYDCESDGDSEYPMINNCADTVLCPNQG